MTEVQSIENTQPQTEKTNELPYGELWGALEKKDNAKIMELARGSVPLAEKLPDAIRAEVAQYFRNIIVHAGLVNANCDHWRQIKACINQISKTEWRFKNRAA